MSQFVGAALGISINGFTRPQEFHFYLKIKGFPEPDSRNPWVHQKTFWKSMGSKEPILTQPPVWKTLCPIIRMHFSGWIKLPIKNAFIREALLASRSFETKLQNNSNILALGRFRHQCSLLGLFLLFYNQMYWRSHDL